MNKLKIGDYAVTTARLNDHVPANTLVKIVDAFSTTSRTKITVYGGATVESSSSDDETRTIYDVYDFRTSYTWKSIDGDRIRAIGSEDAKVMRLLYG